MSTELSDVDVEALRVRATVGRRPDPVRLFGHAVDVDRRRRRRRRGTLIVVAVVVVTVLIPVVALRRGDAPSVVTLELPHGSTVLTPTSLPTSPTPTTSTEPTTSPVPGDPAALIRSGGIMVGDGGDLVVIDPETGARVLAQRGLVGSWSPDRQQLAVGTSSRTSDDGLSVMALDGSARRQVYFSLAARPSDPVWSPDGRRLAFTAPANNPDTIMVVNVDGSGTQVVGKGRQPSWAPDGTAIYANTLDEYVQLQRIPLDGSAAQVITHAPGEHAAPEAGPNAVAFLNDDGGISTSDLDGSNIRVLTSCVVSGCNGDRQPVWSPDGRQIAVLRSTGTAPDTTLVVIDVATGRVTNEIRGFHDPQPSLLSSQPSLLSWR